jgi:hypothetical protein
MAKLLLIGSQHGHELLGDHLWDYIKTHRRDLLPNLEYVVANPRAKAGGVRLIESDMNRSYNGKNSTYEERLATKLLEKSRTGGYAFALDLHTTTTAGPPVIITGNFKQAWKFIRSSGISRVVKMPKKIVEVSYIGSFPNSVSVEVNEADAKNPKVLAMICDDIERFIAKKASQNSAKEYFLVTSHLAALEVPPSEIEKMTNYAKSNLGFYPVLMGEKSYNPSQYIGFKARKIEPPHGVLPNSR